MGGVTLGRGGSPASYPIKQSSSATQLIGRSKFGGGASGFASLDSSRDSSRERLASGGFPFPKPPSRHPSGRDDSSQERGRPDSRQSDNMLPDLERFQDAASGSSVHPPSRTASATRAAERQRMMNRQTTPPPAFPASSDTSAAASAPKFNPSTDVLEKRRKVLKSMASDKQLVKEAKGLTFF